MSNIILNQLLNSSNPEKFNDYCNNYLKFNNKENLLFIIIKNHNKFNKLNFQLSKETIDNIVYNSNYSNFNQINEKNNIFELISLSQYKGINEYFPLNLDHLFFIADKINFSGYPQKTNDSFIDFLSSIFFITNELHPTYKEKLNNIINNTSLYFSQQYYSNIEQDIFTLYSNLLNKDITHIFFNHFLNHNDCSIQTKFIYIFYNMYNEEPLSFIKENLNDILNHNNYLLVFDNIFSSEFINTPYHNQQDVFDTIQDIVNTSIDKKLLLSIDNLTLYLKKYNLDYYTHPLDILNSEQFNKLFNIDNYSQNDFEKLFQFKKIPLNLSKIIIEKLYNNFYNIPLNTFYNFLNILPFSLEKEKIETIIKNNLNNNLINKNFLFNFKTNHIDNITNFISINNELNTHKIDFYYYLYNTNKQLFSLKPEKQKILYSLIKNSFYDEVNSIYETLIKDNNYSIENNPKFKNFLNLSTLPLFFFHSTNLFHQCFNDILNEKFLFIISNLEFKSKEKIIFSIIDSIHNLNPSDNQFINNLSYKLFDLYLHNNNGINFNANNNNNTNNVLSANDILILKLKKHINDIPYLYSLFEKYLIEKNNTINNGINNINSSNVRKKTKI